MVHIRKVFKIHPKMSLGAKIIRQVTYGYPKDLA